MDDDTIELVRQLCTRIGMIMEDASSEALVSDFKRSARPDGSQSAPRLRTAIPKWRRW